MSWCDAFAFSLRQEMVFVYVCLHLQQTESELKDAPAVISEMQTPLRS